MQQRFSTIAERDRALSTGSHPRLRWARKAALALAAMLASASFGAASCGGGVATGSSSTGTTAGTTSGSTMVDECKGGVIVNGHCEGKCTPDKCIANNTCVGNRCMLKCDAHTDCYTGVQNCAPAKEDDTNADIHVCQESGLAPVGSLCPFGNECEALTACPDGRACDYKQCGGMECKRDDAACGQDAECLIGKCPDTMPCTVPACPMDQCKPLLCRTTGAGDAEAFCTLPDCTEDKDCPGGYTCGIVHDPHEVCGTMKGNNNFCGKTTEPCIDPANAPPGTTYFEGSVCLLRRMCLKRDDCAPCETDLDCSQLGSQICVGTGPAGMDKRCATTCGSDKDCGPQYKCVAGPDGMTKACVPRFSGGCKGSGNFCEPCVNDEDCAMAGGPTVGCLEVDLSGERACFDLSFPADCMSDADCPTTPGGKHGHCFDEDDGVSPGDTVYHKCYFPYDANDNKFSCW